MHNVYVQIKRLLIRLVFLVGLHFLHFIMLNFVVDRPIIILFYCIIVYFLNVGKPPVTK